MQKWLWKMTNTQAITKTLALMILSLATNVAQAESLNKCVDIYGKVTYSNLTCKGANQARKIEIDPAPPAPKMEVPVTVAPKAAQIRTEKNAAVKLETFGTAPKKPPHNTCDTLTDKLGLVLDKMDAARRKGYTQKQMDEWNLDIKSLERKKQQAGCF